MPLRPELSLNVPTLELPNPMAQAMQLTQMQNALQQQRMGDIQMQNALREQSRKQQLEQLMAGFEPTTPAATMASALQKRGYFSEAGALIKQDAERLKTLREAEAAQIKSQTDRLGLMGQLLSGVSDQSTLDAVRPQIARIPGVTEDDLRMLQTYGDGSMIKRLANASMTAYQRESLANAKATAEAAKQRADAAARAAAVSEAKLPFEQRRAEAAERLAEQGRVPADVRTFREVQQMPEAERSAYEAFQASKRPQTTVNIDQQGEKAETVERGKGYVKHETDVRNAAAAARKSLIGIESAQNVLNKGFETGFGKETLAKGASVLAALGVDKAEQFATNSQKFLQAATERVLAAQLEQKGVQTNQDAQRIEQLGARMGNTKAANEFILDVARAQAERAIAHDKFYRDWLRDPKNNNSLRGAEDAWLESEGNKSIFESPRLKKYGVLESERTPATTAPAGPVVGGRSATPRGPATAVPQAAIDALLKGQGTDAQFDEIFGRGAAAAARAGGR